MKSPSESTRPSTEALPGIHVLIQVLSEEAIEYCLVGELGLMYYNVPRIVHDIEICVPAVDLERATATFESKADLYKASPELKGNLYTDYKLGFPRFQLLSNHESYVVLFPDSALHLDPLSQSTIPPAWHTHEAKYSKEILDSFPAGDLSLLSFPCLAPLFLGYCRRFCRSNSVVSAMAAEQLVDGMDLDEGWLEAQSPAMTLEEKEFATKLVQEKKSHIDDLSENQITCYIPNKEEALRVLQIPDCGAKHLTQGEKELTSRSFLMWLRSILRCS